MSSSVQSGDGGAARCSAILEIFPCELVPIAAALGDDVITPPHPPSPPPPSILQPFLTPGTRRKSAAPLAVLGSVREGRQPIRGRCVCSGSGVGGVEEEGVLGVGEGL